MPIGSIGEIVAGTADFESRATIVANSVGVTSVSSPYCGNSASSGASQHRLFRLTRNELAEHSAVHNAPRPYTDLRQFMEHLEASGELRRIREPVSPNLEMTEVSDRVLRAGGPALLFEQATGFELPVLTNLFGTTARVAAGMGQTDVHSPENEPT